MSGSGSCPTTSTMNRGASMSMGACSPTDAGTIHGPMDETEAEREQEKRLSQIAHPSSSGCQMTWDAATLFQILDRDGSGTISEKEFVSGVELWMSSEHSRGILACQNYVLRHIHGRYAEIMRKLGSVGETMRQTAAASVYCGEASSGGDDHGGRGSGGDKKMKKATSRELESATKFKYEAESSAAAGTVAKPRRQSKWEQEEDVAEVADEEEVGVKFIEQKSDLQPEKRQSLWLPPVVPRLPSPTDTADASESAEEMGMTNNASYSISPTAEEELPSTTVCPSSADDSTSWREGVGHHVDVKPAFNSSNHGDHSLWRVSEEGGIGNHNHNHLAHDGLSQEIAQMSYRVALQKLAEILPDLERNGHFSF
eukprot:g10167.t1